MNHLKPQYRAWTVAHPRASDAAETALILLAAILALVGFVIAYDHSDLVRAFMDALTGKAGNPEAYE